jgi:hypothetical protein
MTKAIRKDTIRNAERDAAICAAVQANPMRSDVDIARELGTTKAIVMYIRRTRLNFRRPMGGARNVKGNAYKHVPRRVVGRSEPRNGLFNDVEQGRLWEFNAQREPSGRAELLRDVRSTNPRRAARAAKLLEERFHCRVVHQI